MVEKIDAREEEGKGLPRVVVFGIVIVVIGVVAFMVLSQKRKFEPVVAGAEAIEFSLPDLKGQQHSLKDFRGKVVFLNFWATWCEPCEDEMPSMQMLYDSLEGEPFEIVAVSVDSEGADVVEKFVKKYGLTFTVLHDRRGRIKDTYKTTGVPETFIIDQNGVIAEKVWGPRDWSSPASITTIMNLLKYGPKAKEAYGS